MNKKNNNNNQANNNKGRHNVKISKLIRSRYNYCSAYCSFCKKMLFKSVFVFLSLTIYSRY